MDKAFDHGVFFFDTANAYPLGSTPETIGRTEDYIGRWLKGRREQIILATKFALPMSSSPNNQGGSREHIMRSIEGSLRRLQTDYIDMAQVAIAWVLAQPTMTSAIVGASKPEQLDQTLPAVDLKLDEHLLEACNAIWYQLPREPNNEIAYR
jgi:aryl-alcohol dehydrogenase-like predicted oxidoreductase